MVLHVCAPLLSEMPHRAHMVGALLPRIPTVKIVFAHLPYILKKLIIINLFQTIEKLLFLIPSHTLHI